MLVSLQALEGLPSSRGCRLSRAAAEHAVILVPQPIPGRGQCLPDALAGRGPPLPARSCLGLDHRTLSCQSSRGYPEWGRTSQNPLRNLRH